MASAKQDEAQPNGPQQAQHDVQHDVQHVQPPPPTKDIDDDNGSIPGELQRAQEGVLQLSPFSMGSISNSKAQQVPNEELPTACLHFQEDPVVSAVRAVVRAELRELQELLREQVTHNSRFQTSSTAKAAGQTAEEESTRPSGRISRVSFQEPEFEEAPRRHSTRSDKSIDMDSMNSQLADEVQAKEHFSEIVREMTRNESDVRQRRSSHISESDSPAYIWSYWMELAEYYYELTKSIKEPRRRGFLARLTKSKRFELVIMTTVLVNCAFMGWSADIEVRNPGESRQVLLIGDWVFQVIYTVELALRLMVHRQYFFVNQAWRANWFDAFLVAVGWLGLALDGTGGVSGSFLRVLRLAKVGRTLRAVRIISEIKHMRALVTCLQGSFMSFIWSLVMLVVVLLIFSLFMVQILGSHLADVGDDLTDDMERMYGTVIKSTLTLFRAATGGDDWAVSYEVFSQTGWFGSSIYLVFIAFTQLALINIITGIFVARASDRETIITENLRMEKENAFELERLCRLADTDSNGRISPMEFEESLHSDRIRRLLIILGLSKHHVKEFFKVLSDLAIEDEGEVDIGAFVSGCMQLKGAATNFDVQMIHAELRSMFSRQDRRMADLGEQIGKLQQKSANASPFSSQGPSSTHRE